MHLCSSVLTCVLVYVDTEAQTLATPQKSCTTSLRQSLLTCLEPSKHLSWIINDFQPSTHFHLLSAMTTKTPHFKFVRCVPEGKLRPSCFRRTLYPLKCIPRSGSRIFKRYNFLLLFGMLKVWVEILAYWAGEITWGIKCFLLSRQENQIAIPRTHTAIRPAVPAHLWRKGK